MLPIAIEEYKKIIRKAKASWVANEGNSGEEGIIGASNEEERS